MGRLQPKFIERVDEFAARVLDVVQVLERAKVARRVVDQIVGSGTAVGADLAEADEAMSNADSFKCIAITLKESSETSYRLRLISKKGWIRPARLAPSRVEADELKRILGAMVSSKRARSRLVPV